MTREDFRENYCFICGSQRCDASDEMMNYCHQYLEERANGICRRCYHLYLCDEVKRGLEMLECNQFCSAGVLKR